MKTSRVVVSLLCALVLLSAGAAALAASDASRPPEGEVVIEIHHCTTCGYKVKAEQTAAEIKNELGYDSALVVGKVGSFDVFIDGVLLFSKKETGRFPKPGEIVKLIHEYLDKEGKEVK